MKPGRNTDKKEKKNYRQSSNFFEILSDKVKLYTPQRLTRPLFFTPLKLSAFIYFYFFCVCYVSLSKFYKTNINHQIEHFQTYPFLTWT